MWFEWKSLNKYRTIDTSTAYLKLWKPLSNTFFLSESICLGHFETLILPSKIVPLGLSVIGK
jgi:hypothetical protein